MPSAVLMCCVAAAFLVPPPQQQRRTLRLQVGDGDGGGGSLMLQIGAAELNEAAARAEGSGGTRTGGRLSIMQPPNASVLSAGETNAHLRIRAVLTLPREHSAVAPLLHRSEAAALCARINGRHAGCRSANSLADSFVVQTRGLIRTADAGRFWQSLSLSLAVRQWHFEASVVFDVARAPMRGQSTGQDAGAGLQQPRLALFSAFMEGTRHRVGAPPPPPLASGTKGATHTAFFGACFDRSPESCDARAAAASFCVDHGASVDFRALLLGRRSWAPVHAPDHRDDAVHGAAANAVHVMLPITPGRELDRAPTIAPLCMLCMLHSFKARAAASARDRHYGVLEGWAWPPAMRLPPQLRAAKSGVVIPRVLHRIWLGPLAQPRGYAAFEAEWRRLHPPPRWRVVTWRDSDLAGLPLSKVGRSLLAPGSIADPRARADVLRLELMFHLGGCYADADVEPLRSLDGVLEQAQQMAHTARLGSLAVAALEAPDVVGNAFLCSTPGASYFGRLLAALPAWLARHDRLWLQDRRRQRADSDGTGSGARAPHIATWRRTGPYYLSRAATAVGEDILLLPRHSFYERHFSQSGTPALATGMQTLGRHHWGWSSAAGTTARSLLPAIGNQTRLRLRGPSVWLELAVEVPLATQLNNSASPLGGVKAKLAAVRNWRVCAYVQLSRGAPQCSSNESFCNVDTKAMREGGTATLLTCTYLDREQPVLLQNKSGRGPNNVEHELWRWRLRIALGAPFHLGALTQQTNASYCRSARLLAEISLLDGSGFEACESRHPWFDMPLHATCHV